MRRFAEVAPLPGTSPAGDLRRLGPLLRPYLWPILFGTVCGILGIVAELFPPLVWGYVVDHVIKSRRVDWLWRPILLMAAVYLVGVILTAARRNVMEKAGQAFLFDLRNRLYGKLQRQSLAYFGEHRTGDLMARVGGDIDTIQDVVIRGTDAVVANALRLIGVAIIFVSLQWQLGLICLIPIALVGAGLKLYNSRIRGLYRVSRARLGDVGAKLQDNLSGIRVVKAFAREQDEQAAFEQATQAYRTAQVGVINLSTRYFPLVRYISQWGQILMLGFGAYFIMVGRFTIGGLITYRGYGRYFFGPIDDLMDINDTLQRASAAWGRVLEVMDSPESVTDRPDAAVISASRGEVRFENVEFGYSPGHPVLRGVSFTALPGQMIALVGSSGAGKSTVLNLLPRFWDVTAGAVLVDGIDVRDVTQASLRSVMALVQQDTFLFNDTVLNNIRYGRPDATEEAVESAARMANAHDFISVMPQGYATVVGERGVRLSGGQRQRISIARAFLADPRILLLDEATSAVEPESEWIIQAALERLMAGRTTIVVSHRMSMVRGADEILVLDQGLIAERGRHEDLLEQNGLYARMVAMQQGDMLPVT